MIRGTIALVAAAALAAALTATALGGSRAATLNGTVGPGFTITLKMAGKKVTKLKAGTYKLVVSDKASIHNFVVEQEEGGKFEKDITSVPFTGTKTMTLKLTKGEWKYYCAPHESAMFGKFNVT
jgi:plastocyanin